jgi:hypothetical protein
MNYGHLLLIINLLAFGIAFLSYLYHEILRDSRYLKLGRWFFLCWHWSQSGRIGIPSVSHFQSSV